MAVKKWRGKRVVDLVVDDRRNRRVSPMRTRRGAKAFEVELLREAAEAPASRVEVAPTVPTLAAFADDWMATAVAVQNKPSERTRKRSILRNHLVPFFGKRRLDHIARRDVERFEAHQIEKGLAVGTVNRHAELLAGLMRCAAEWGLIEQVPVIRGLPGEQAETDSVWRGQLGTPKSGRSRVVPMSSDLVEVLTAWRRYSAGESSSRGGRADWPIPIRVPTAR